jgi:hypothetical protein
MKQSCHVNDLGSLSLCSPFESRVLAVPFASQLVTTRVL